MSAAIAAGEYVFSDPIAFRHLAQEDRTDIVEENVVIEGYQVYIVEQWACSRKHPVFVVTTFTGDESNKVTVSVLRIRSEDEYSERIKHYFDTLAEYHARPKDTPKGKIFVTNLSSFPSALNVIIVPDGCVDVHREEFVVNENLRRMGCTGRSALTLEPPTDATQDKFHQLYRTSDKIDFAATVLDLVKLVQSCLHLFGVLEVEYLDGLLCDVTEQSIIEWWNVYGTRFYDVEPSDGIMGPTTVAGILGMTLGIRYRLLSVRVEAPKDMMDIEHFKEAIGHFQRGVKLERTRILDKPTLDKLYNLTVRSGTGEHRLPGHKTLRTTVHDLSNRTMVNAADIETCDIEEFINHVHGERLKYMWQGKGRRPSTSSVTGLTPSASFNDLKDTTVRQKMIRGVKHGAKGVGKMVIRGPEHVLERVQGQRANRREKERDRERDGTDEMLMNASELGEPLTAVTTRDSESGKDAKLTPTTSRIMARYGEESALTETPRSSVSEPRSPSQICEPPKEVTPPPGVYALDRPKSASDEQTKEHHDSWYPRRLSFSIAQDAIETWPYPFEIETDRLEHEVQSINKWTEDQLDLVEESMDKLGANIPTIAANYASDIATFNSVQLKAKQVTQRVNTFNDRTKGIYDTTMKLRYAYSSADGLKEKIASVETLMRSLQGRRDKLLRRIDAVEKLRLRFRLERRYRMRWLTMTGIVLVLGLALAFFYIR